MARRGDASKTMQDVRDLSAAGNSAIYLRQVEAPLRQPANREVMRIVQQQGPQFNGMGVKPLYVEEETFYARIRFMAAYDTYWGIHSQTMTLVPGPLSAAAVFRVHTMPRNYKHEDADTGSVGLHTLVDDVWKPVSVNPTGNLHVSRAFEESIDPLDMYSRQSGRFDLYGTDSRGTYALFSRAIKQLVSLPPFLDHARQRRMPISCTDWRSDVRNSVVFERVKEAAGLGTRRVPQTTPNEDAAFQLPAPLHPRSTLANSTYRYT